MPRKRFNLVVQVTGPARTAELWGHTYDVLPVTMVQEQVLHNNLGSTFLPADEIAASVNAWDGMPVVLDHPKAGGKFVSARSPGIMNEVGVGYLYEVVFDEATTELRGLAYLDPNRVAAVDGAAPIVNGAKEGKKGEVSTGFSANIEYAAGEFNGEAYDIIMRGIAPDHLALLSEGKVGACSVADGCGLAANILSSARTPKYSGTEEVAWKAPTLATYLSAAGIEAGTQVGDLTAAQKQAIAAHTLLGDAGADTFADLSFFPVVNPSTGKLNKNALNAVISGRGAQANIAAAAKTSAQNKARSLLDKEFPKPASQEKPPGRVRRLLADLAALLPGLEEAGNQSIEDMREQLTDLLRSRFGGTDRWVYIVATFPDEAEVVYEVEGPGAGDQAGHYRIKYNEASDGSVTLVGDPEQVRKVTTFTPVAAQAAPAGPHTQPAGKEKRLMEREKVIAKLAAQTGLTAEALNELDDAQLTAMQEKYPCQAGNEGGGGGASGDPATGAEGGSGTPPAKEPAKPAGNEGEGDSGLAALTAAVQGLADRFEKVEAGLEEQREATREAVQQRAQEKADLVEALAANDRCPFNADELKARTMEELQKLDSMARGVSYAGMGGPRGKAGNEAEPKVMPIAAYHETEKEA